MNKYKYIYIKKIFYQLSFILVLSTLFLLDDYIFKLFNNVNKATFTFEFFSLALALSTSISIIQNKKIIYIILSIFAFIETTQLVYLSYFGYFLHPAIIHLMYKEIIEIQETGLASISSVYYAFLSVIIPYGVMFFIIKKYHHKLYTFKFSWIIFLLFVSLIPMRAIRDTSIQRMLANPEYPSIYNGLKVYSGYFFNILPTILKENTEEYNFKEYLITKNESVNNKMNIVLIYGESFNYYNQSLYGYEYNTTPNLLELSKDYKNFTYKKGIASAVATQQSIPAFFNLQREPKNYKMQINMKFNLFKLAKEQGFKTFFISAQKVGLFNNLGRQFIDVFITVEDEKELFDIKRDEALLTILKNQELSDKNFIVLHQRNIHSPYEKNYSHKQKEFDKFESSYDNATLYNDYLYKHIITYFTHHSQNPLYFFITSDHGELTGQNGLYGHVSLIPEVANIPIILYTRNANSNIQNEFKNMFMPTHYELGILLAKIMGYTIINPNILDDIFYINGNDSMGRFGYIKLQKDKKNNKINYEVIN